MKLICVHVLCLIIFVNQSETLDMRMDHNLENINDLRYPQPLNFTSTFPFRVLRTIFNMTSIDQSLERGSNRITSQVSAVVDVLRRVLRYMLRNALAISPLRTNNFESGTKTNVKNESKISFDLPAFSVVNDTKSTPSNKTEELSNKI